MGQNGGIRQTISELLGERGPLPEVVEQDSDNCWKLWHEALAHLEPKKGPAGPDLCLPDAA